MSRFLAVFVVFGVGGVTGCASETSWEVTLDVGTVEYGAALPEGFSALTESASLEMLVTDDGKVLIPAALRIEGLEPGERVQVELRIEDYEAGDKVCGTTANLATYDVLGTGYINNLCMHLGLAGIDDVSNDGREVVLVAQITTDDGVVAAAVKVVRLTRAL
jgi:hypothetical protein